MTKDLISFIREFYNSNESIPLHRPVFRGNEIKYLTDCIHSSYVSSIGSYVNRFEKLMSEITNTKKAIAVVNGTAALQVALKLVGVKENTEVITQGLTFVAQVSRNV